MSSLFVKSLKASSIALMGVSAGAKASHCATKANHDNSVL